MFGSPYYSKVTIAGQRVAEHPSRHSISEVALNSPIAKAFSQEDNNWVDACF
jgi:hypothetical protein